ncbi:MAG: MFS transporter [Candidatus Helarchaeota archaeon]|nr:MFS transporter [Candidatus Helarchaeota archaeon]
MEEDNLINSEFSKNIVFSGILVLLTITGVSILHTNEYEFIVLRFPWLTLFETSLFDSTLYMSYLIMGIFAGILSDRLGKRKIFTIIGSGCSIIFFWLMTITLEFGILLIFRFCQGVFIVLSWQILMTIILDLSTSENRGKNMGIFGIFLATAMGIGPVLGGLFASMGVFIPYYVAMILNGIVFILSFFLMEPKQIKKNPSLKKILNSVQRHPKLIVPGLFNFIDRLHMGFIIFILPMYLQMVLYKGPELRGMVLGLYALPFILLQYPIGKLSDKVGRYKPLIIGSLGYGIVLSSIAFFGTYGFLILIILFIILGIFAGTTTPPTMALIGDIVSKEENAIAMGFFNFVGNFGIIIGPLIAGYIITYSNFDFAFLIVGIIEIISLGVILLILLKFKELG